MFVSLDRRPRIDAEGAEFAQAIMKLRRNETLARMESEPISGIDVRLGNEKIGQAIDIPLVENRPWSAAAVSDFSLIYTAFQLAEGNLVLPGMSSRSTLTLPMSTIDRIGKVGMFDRNIAGGPAAPFTLSRDITGVPTYPMLWNHDANRETNLVVKPDSEGRVKPRMLDRASDVWDTRSFAHHNRDFSFTSHALSVAITDPAILGGRAWPNISLGDRKKDIAYSLWGNSTLGLLLYWSHASRQQSGRGIMPITMFRRMPTLNIQALSDTQLETAQTIFTEMQERTFLPANEAWRDESRKELDRRVLVEMLGLP